MRKKKFIIEILKDFNTKINRFRLKVLDDIVDLKYSIIGNMDNYYYKLKELLKNEDSEM